MLKNVGENIKKNFAVLFFYAMDIKNTIFNPKFYQHFLPSLNPKTFKNSQNPQKQSSNKVIKLYKIQTIFKIYFDYSIVLMCYITVITKNVYTLQQWYSTWGTRVICDTLTKKIVTLCLYFFT